MKNNTRRELQWKLGGWGESDDNDEVNSDVSRGECFVRSSSHCRAAIRARTKHRKPRGWKNVDDHIYEQAGNWVADVTMSGSGGHTVK